MPHQSAISRATVCAAVMRSGTPVCSSGAWATFTSPAPYITHAAAYDVVSRAAPGEFV